MSKKSKMILLKILITLCLGIYVAVSIVLLKTDIGCPLTTAICLIAMFINGNILSVLMCELLDTKYSM